MEQAVPRFEVHEVAGTELRVVSDVDGAVAHVVGAEDDVVCRYVARGLWRHEWVDLFILRDLQVLAEHLQNAVGLPPGGSRALDRRPVVNAFDLADLSGCHVFVNHRVMVEEGYWEDPQAVRALLAHEHAHPLSENATVAASRALRVRRPPAPRVAGAPSLQELGAAMVDKLCCYGPREVFANDLTLAAGSADDLFHLDQLVLAAAADGIAGRSALVDHLEADVRGGAMSRQDATGALVLGDLRSTLDVAMETAPFYRAGRTDAGQALEATLVERIFPRLSPVVEGAYIAVRDLYIELRPNFSGPELLAWAGRMVDALVTRLSEHELPLDVSLDYSKKGEGRDA